MTLHTNASVFAIKVVDNKTVTIMFLCDIYRLRCLLNGINQ